MDHLTYMWTDMVQLFYITYISVDLAHHEIFRGKFGNIRVVKLEFYGIHLGLCCSLMGFKCTKGKKTPEKVR